MSLKGDPQVLMFLIALIVATDKLCDTSLVFLLMISEKSSWGLIQLKETYRVRIIFTLICFPCTVSNTIRVSLQVLITRDIDFDKDKHDIHQRVLI